METSNPSLPKNLEAFLLLEKLKEQEQEKT